MTNGCPTVESGEAGRAESCKGCPNASICASAKPDPDIDAIKRNLSQIKLVVCVLSGKGGVGKSTVACNVASSLAEHGVRTLILDFDLSGPSVPRLTCTVDEIAYVDDGRLRPIAIRDNLYAASVGYMEAGEKQTGAFSSNSKNFTIRQILRLADFSGVDVLVVDTPPNITDEHLALAKYMERLYGIIVCTPQQIAFNDVVRQVTFCRKIGVEILGMVENMKQFECGCCGHVNAIFGEAHAEGFCRREAIPYLGSIRLKTAIARASDSGAPLAEPLFGAISKQIIEILGRGTGQANV
ncbi:hypothetical protein PAPHI01_0738 [Pancytospora philotis]|nr:hypothetical protein PAPHI01_0738 [Pancytospora philotis]